MDYSNKDFVIIDGQTYTVSDLDRGYERDIENINTVNNERHQRVNKLQSYYRPELTTTWLDKTERDGLVAKLKKDSVTIDGLVVSPYYNYLDTATFYPRLQSEEEDGDMYKITFELEAL